MTKKKIVITREKQDIKDTWALEDLYTSVEAWEKEYEELEGLSKSFGEFQKKGICSSKDLLCMLNQENYMEQLLSRLYVYANERLHQDMSNDFSQKLAGKAAGIQVKVQRATAFVVPMIQGMTEKQMEEYREETKEIGEYQLLLKRILKRKPHSRSEEVETLLADIGELTDAPSDIFAMFNNADLHFPPIKNSDGEEVEVTHGKYQQLLESKDREIRRQAFQSVFEAYRKNENMLSTVFDANVRQSCFYAKVRNYDSSLEAALNANEIPLAVYTNLIQTVKERLPLMYRYTSLRKKVLGLEELHLYDIQVPLISEIEIQIPYEQAKEMVSEGLRPLGKEYQEILKEGFEQRWIDVYENIGKRSGAYSWGTYGTHPYVLLNYQDNLGSVFTLAHEMGHAIHSYYSNKTQPFQYAGYRIFVAEVASTCNEALLIHDMIEKSRDKKEKAYLVNHFLNQFRSTLYRQTMFAEFEQKMHKKVEEGEHLTANLLGNTYYELVKEYFGPDLCADELISYEWARIPHFYTPFYVYQYATGFSAAIAISTRILKEGASAVEAYLKFLKGGSSMTPIELLRQCGIDMESSKPVADALKVFEEYLGYLEELL